MNAAAEYWLRNEPQELPRIQGWLEAFGRRHGLSPAVVHHLDLATVEWVTNVIAYAFPDRAEHRIGLRMHCAEETVTIEIEDDGKPFNLLEHPAVDTSVPINEKPIGGLGIHMIRRLVDDVQYRRQSGKNIVCLIKKLR